MPFRYWAYFTLPTLPKVATGECARLVQHFIPQVGHTSTWKAGERVVDVLERGGDIERGTAIANFVKGRYPQSGHRHAAFYGGAIRGNSGRVMGLILIDQWNPKPGDPARPQIKERSIYRKKGVMLSDDPDAFYVIER